MGSARYVVADVTVEEQIAAAVAEAASPRGHLDILFANAGGSFHMGPMAEADVEGVRATIDLNLVGTFLCIKHAAPLMAAGSGAGVDGGEAPGGSIIGMSSGAGHFPHRFLWAYGSAKAGIDMLCKYAAEELGATGVRVNTVQPGIVDDELMSFITAGWPAARRLPGRDAHQPAGHGRGHRRRRPVPGRPRVRVDHRGGPGRRRGPPPAPRGQLRPAVRLTGTRRTARFPGCAHVPVA